MEHRIWLIILRNDIIKSPFTTHINRGYYLARPYWVSRLWQPNRPVIYSLAGDTDGTWTRDLRRDRPTFYSAEPRCHLIILNTSFNNFSYSFFNGFSPNNFPLTFCYIIVDFFNLLFQILHIIFLSAVINRHRRRRQHLLTEPPQFVQYAYSTVLFGAHPL